jgi:hypothetical protein
MPGACGNAATRARGRAQTNRRPSLALCCRSSSSATRCTPRRFAALEQVEEDLDVMRASPMARWRSTRGMPKCPATESSPLAPDLRQ